MVTLQDKFGGMTRYNPDRHRIIAPNGFVNYLRGEFRCELLDVVFDTRGGRLNHSTGRHEGCWLLVEWLGERRGPMKELLILGSNPVGTRAMVESLRSMDRASTRYAQVRKRNKDLLLGYAAQCDADDEEHNMGMQEARNELWRKPGCRGTQTFAVPG